MMDNCKILVCCHKETPRLKDDVFTPILLGSAFADEKLRAEFSNDFWDNMGDNIADLHPYCAELTAIYWAWKNYEKLGNPDYIGLFHYRRFLNFSDAIGDSDLWKCSFFDFEKETCERFGWSEEAISDFCSGYDLILPNSENILDPKDWKTPASLEVHYKHSHYAEDFDAAKKLIKNTYPAYDKVVDEACNAQTGHFCNMFIMSREKFFDYAQWLFSILLPLKEKLNLEGSKYHGVHDNQRRVLGFLGERLFNIWITYQRKMGVDIRETERLTGYLTDADKNQYRNTHGLEEFQQAQRRSRRECKPNLVAQRLDEMEIDVVAHLARSTKKPAVSILLPVYNVGEFLRPCMESLVNQTLKDIELIFVYDTSQDDSLEILMEYYNKDDRIVVIENKDRGGMSRARNIGMKFIRGKYFAFVDSDDVCDQTMFEKLYRKAQQLQADIVTCSVWGFIDTLDNKYLHRQLEWFGDSDKVLPLAQRPQQLMEPAAWCKLFRTSYIRSLDYFEFRPGVVSWEDVPAMTSAFTQTDRIATVQEALYYYRQRSTGNLSNTMTRRYVDEFISGAKMQAEILKKHGPTDWEFCSYIEEFKVLFAKWMLSKLARKDVPYFFHRVGCLFKKEDKPYLERLFTLYPKCKLFYEVMVTRSSLLYVGGRWMFRVGRKLRDKIKNVMKIKREGVYRTFRIGPIRVKQFRKKYLDQTLEWFGSELHGTKNWVTDLQNRLTCLQEANNALEDQNTAIQNRLTCLQETNNALMDLNLSLSTATVRLQNENDALNCTLQEVNQKLLTDQQELDRVNTELKEEREHITVLQTNCLELEQMNGKLKEQKELTESDLAKIRELAGDFYHSVWTTGWVNVWKQYYYENYASIEQKKAELKRSLDPESVELIDRLCYRNFNLLPNQEDSDLFLYNHKRIYTEEELAGAAEPLDEDAYRAKYVLPGDVHLETPVFKYHCGLSMLPEDSVLQMKGRDVIDGGAYWGDSALVLHEYNPRSIHAFEPQPENFARLQETIRANQMEEEVTAIEAGLGDKKAVGQLYTNGMLSGSNLANITPSICNEDSIVNDIRILTIDEYAEANNLDVGLIKLDIEGNELAAIRGAEKTIRRCRPLISIAVYHHPQDFFEIKPLLEKMNLGYRFFVRKLVFHDLVTEVMLLGYPE